MDQYMAASRFARRKSGRPHHFRSARPRSSQALIEPFPDRKNATPTLLEEGAAIRCNNLPAAAWENRRPSRRHRPFFTRMKDRARKLGRSNAAADIAADALNC